MTPEEAIKSLQNIVEYWTYKPTEVEAAKMAIAALKEVQKYREIGTVEECREAVEKQAAERINYETNAVFNNGFGYYRIGKCRKEHM